MNHIDLKIEHAFIVTVNQSDDILYDATLCVQNGVIVAIGSYEEYKDISADTIIDAQGNVVMPGLINTHTHVGMSIFRGMADDLPLQTWLNDYIFPTEAQFCTRENVAIGTQLSILEMIQGGTTCFADMYYFEDTVAEICNTMGIRAVLAQAIVDFPAPDFENPHATLESLDTTISLYKNNSRISVIPGPHSPYTCSLKILQQARTLANKHNVPLHIHVSETQHEYTQNLEKYSQTPIEYLAQHNIFSGKTIAAHCVYMSEHDREILSQHAVGVVNNPQSNLKLISGIAPVPLMKEADIPVALGTDSAVSNNSLDMFQEMKTAALIHKLNNANPTVLPAKEIVRMATIDGANVLGIDDKVGSIEIGKQADIIIININQPHLVPLYSIYSHIVYAMNRHDVDTVFVDGVCLYQNKQFTLADPLEIMINAQTIANAIQEKYE